MLTNEQIDIAVKFWTGLFNRHICDISEQSRFAKSLHKIIIQQRNNISTIALQVVPHLILGQALKEAKLHPFTLPFRKLDISFQEGKVYLYERDKLVKILTKDNFAVK